MASVCLSIRLLLTFVSASYLLYQRFFLFETSNVLLIKTMQFECVIKRKKMNKTYQYFHITDQPRCVQIEYNNVFGGDKIYKASRVSSQQECEEICDKDSSCSTASHVMEGLEQWCGLYKTGQTEAVTKTNSVLIDFICKQGIHNFILFIIQLLEPVSTT